MNAIPFRLPDATIAFVDRWASNLSKKAGRKVTRAEAIRFILEGYRRAEAHAPEIGDLALLDLVSRES